MSEHRFAASVANIKHWFREDVEKAVDLVGGPARLQVIVLLACVLGLDAGDKATVGAIAVKLEQAFGIGNVQIGLLVTASTAIGAFATLPLGILADRVRRVRLLTIAVVVWSLAMAVSGASTSYLMLLLTRLALGAIVATAAPTVASLIGDFFRPKERGRIYGFILTGELIGAAFGFVISGDVADALSWRASFWVLAVIGFAIAAALWLWLPEPARGGQSRMKPGATAIPSADESTDAEPGDPAQTAQDAGRSDGRVEEEIKEAEISPDRPLVLHEDPTHMSWLRAAWYILSIRTNLLIILASALGYFYLTGLRTFGVVYIRARFGLGQSEATSILVAIGIGAIVGVLVIGRASDWMIDRGHFNARIWAGAISFLIAAGFFLPGFLVPSLGAAAVLFFFGAVGVGGVNPPMDAARLDIMHSRLWGRAESVRSSLRYAFEAIAPMVFGYVSTLFGGSGGAFRQAAGHGNSNTGAGLGPTLLIMLIVLIGAGVCLFFALPTYAEDVATAMESEENTESGR
ncbi:MAG TPA: MFS transporter [Gammaproteobacteria bacterium]|nr:MFS transporter [Gammaproteobacteria bacterium]